jgi:hypothetical protein
MMKDLLLQLLETIESIGEEHEELYDTVCRHNMRGAIHDGFLKPKDNYELPTDFGLEDENANLQVRNALQQYLKGASAEAAKLRLDFRSRLAAFQDEEVITEQSQSYDDFFGDIPESFFDNAGNWIGGK